MRELSTPSGGGKYAATGVMEIMYEERVTNEPDAWWELPDNQGTIPTILSCQLHKTEGGYAATGVIEIKYEDRQTDSGRDDAQWELV